MTDYTELARRLREHAEAHASVSPYNDEQRQWEADARTAADLIEAMGQQKPIGVIYKTTGLRERWIFVTSDRPTANTPGAIPVFAAAQPQEQREPTCKQSLQVEPTEAQIKARDALLDFISENGTASEGVQHYLDRYVRAAFAAKE